MIEKLKYVFLQKSFFVFLLIGVGNTLLNWALMLGLNRMLPLPDEPRFWVSAVIGYALTSALSFTLNRRFSFHSHGPLKRELPRFILVVAACFFIGNVVAKWLMGLLLARPAFQFLAGYGNQAAMLFGNVVFTILNYVGQRFFAFRAEDRP